MSASSQFTLEGNLSCVNKYCDAIISYTYPDAHKSKDTLDTTLSKLKKKIPVGATNMSLRMPTVPGGFKVKLSKDQMKEFEEWHPHTHVTVEVKTQYYRYQPAGKAPIHGIRLNLVQCHPST